MGTFRSVDVPQLPKLTEYLDAISAEFCPFLIPSVRRDLVTHTVYDLGEIGEERVSEAIFYLGLFHTELVRRVRSGVAPQHRILVCDNLYFRFAGEDEVDGGKIFAWPHWLLKLRYTQVGVLFGKFWKGEEADSRKGVAVPPPPYHMLSVRSAVKPRDPAFFTKAPELLDTLTAAEDNGQEVFGDEIGAVPEATMPGFLAGYQSLSATNLYQHLREEAQKELK